MKTLLLTLLSVNILLATPISYKVLDKDNQEIKNFTLDISKTDTYIRCTMQDSVGETVKIDTNDLNGSTQSFTWKSKNTDIRGDVRDSVLYYKGMFHGKDVNTSISLDEGVPFILNTRDSLVPFIYSTKQSMYLYVTSSNALSAYKFKATKEKEVELKIDGKAYKAIQVDFALTGAMGFFAKSDKLFFSSEDGRFLKRIDSRNNRVELIDVDWD